MEIEKDLGRFSPIGAPAGLRQKVMDRALEARKSAMLSPRMRLAASACSLAIVLVLGLDPLIARQEAARMAALLDGRPGARQPGETLELALALGGNGGEAERLSHLQSLAASAIREDALREFVEARIRLKGWLDNETLENPD